MPKRIIGTVVSTAMNRTAKVEVKRAYLQAKYRKIVTRRSFLLAHDGHNLCNPGDKVELVHCRKLSRKKAHAVVGILQRQPLLEGEPFELAVMDSSKTAES